jgi:hypothetical protein
MKGLEGAASKPLNTPGHPAHYVGMLQTAVGIGFSHPPSEQTNYKYPWTHRQYVNLQGGNHPSAAAR